MTRRQSRHARRAMTMLIALLAVVIASMILLAVVRNAVGEYREVRRQERERQAVWLAQAGIERARAALAVEPAYQGEAWAIDAATLGGRASALLEIDVEPVADRPQARQVRVRADYPPDSHERIRESAQAVIELSDTGTAP